MAWVVFYLLSACSMFGRVDILSLSSKCIFKSETKISSTKYQL